MRRIVVVGASTAGVHAAGSLREHGFEGDLVLVGAEEDLPYDRPPLSKSALTTTVSEEELLLRSPDWYVERGLALILGRAAVHLDVPGRTVQLADGTRLEFDGVVLATGSVARAATGISGDHSGVMLLRTSRDARRLRERLTPGSRLVVIGAGFIGLEIAASARASGVDVTVIEVGAAPLAGVLGAEVGGWFADLHNRHGVTIQCRQSVRSIERDGDRWKVRLGSGDVLVADTVAAGLGATPATEWLESSGLELFRGGVVCDDRLRTQAPGVVAAGDIASWHNRRFGERMRIEHWTNAVEQGRFAALALLGGEGGPFVGPPYFWTDQFDARTRTIGRVTGSDQTHLHRPDADTLVALYGRGDMFRGAVCVNAPRALLACRRALDAGEKMPDVVDAVRA